MKAITIRKKVFACLVLALALSFSLAGCGGAKVSKDDCVGYWELSGGELYGSELDRDFLDKMEYFDEYTVIELKDDGSCRGAVYGKYYEGSWDYDAMTMDWQGFSDVEFTVEGDTLTIVTKEDEKTSEEGTTTEDATYVYARSSDDAAELVDLAYQGYVIETRSLTPDDREDASETFDPAITVVDDEYLKMVVTGKSTGMYSGCGYNVEITNKTDKRVAVVSSQNGSVDGHVVDYFGSIKAGPNESATGYIGLSYYHSLSEIGEAKFEVSLYDLDAENDIAEYAIVIDPQN